MKNIIKLFLLVSVGFALNGCKKSEGNYFGATPFDVISILDVRPIFRGDDVTLSTSNLYGADKLAAVVISNQQGGNLPEGLLVVQDNRRLGLIRGISIDLGADAAGYVPGDSVTIDLVGATLTRKNGILTLTGISVADIKKVGKGAVSINAITTAELLANPDRYESSLCLVNKSGISPTPQPGEVIGGSKFINDGFGNLPLYTDPKVSYANNTPLPMAAYVGIPFKTTEGTVQLRTREADDIIDMGTSVQDVLITGIQSDPKGGDGGHEYVQMMATKDLDFSVTPYSIVFCNNAGASTPALDAGWATGGLRTVKWNMTTGTVKKGQFFYFGFQGRKINGSAGTHSFPADVPYIQKTYTTSGTNPNRGDGGLVRNSTFGTSGPWANSGNTCGVAIFKGTTVTEASVPEDVLFIATGGGLAVYDASKSPILGYRICNNDWYSMYSVVIDPTTYKPKVVPYLHYRSQGNATSMPYPVNETYPTAATDAGLFSMMGGVYNTTLGRWTTGRTQTVVELVQATATIDTLEKHAAVTKLVE